MPAYFALGFIALVGIIYLLRGVSKVDTSVLATVLRYIAIAVMVVGLGLLIVGGRIGSVMLLAGLGYLVWRRWEARGGAAGIGAQRQGPSSGVDTAYLSVSLHHETGTVDGLVKRGQFKGRRLGELSRADLLLLLDEVRREDSEAVPVLEAYLDRIHGPEWRSEGSAAGTEAGGRDQGGPERRMDSALARDEALAMLGLQPGATEAQIREAHHRLMLKLHPDHGGSDYLAARLNEARDVLLGH